MEVPILQNHYLDCKLRQKVRQLGIGMQRSYSHIWKLSMIKVHIQNYFITKMVQLTFRERYISTNSIILKWLKLCVPKNTSPCTTTAYVNWQLNKFKCIAIYEKIEGFRIMEYNSGSFSISKSRKKAFKANWQKIDRNTSISYNLISVVHNKLWSYTQDYWIL